MKKIDIREYFFKQNILVNLGEEPTKNIAELSYALASKFGISIVSGMELASFDMISFCEYMLGVNVPKAFYSGFPKSVLKLVKSDDQLLLLDQLMHYAVTYDMGITSVAGRSIFEEVVERIAFSEDKDLSEFKVITKEEAGKQLADMIDGYLKSSRPLNSNQEELVCAYVLEYGKDVVSCACKETAFALMMNVPEKDFTHLITLNDVIALVEKIVNDEHGKAGKSIKELHLSRKYKKLIASVLDAKLVGNVNYTDCLEKRAAWKGLLHHIHYKPKNDTAKMFVEAIRYGKGRSALSKFEALMEDGDVKGAFDTLKTEKSPALALRNLNYLLSRCENDEDVSYILDNIDTSNPIVAIQLLLRFYRFSSHEPRSFKFVKHKMLVNHVETAEECLARKSHISPIIQAKALSVINNMLEKIYSEKKLGKIYIEPGMEKFALPLQESATQDGYGVMTRGSRLPIPEGKKIRAFTYWEGVDDIDLGVLGFSYDSFSTPEEFSWRTMNYDGKQSEAICFSGDQTSGFDGGSEFFDIDLDKFKKKYPHIRYVVLTNNVFSDLTFDECTCRAGYMMRDINDSGEVFEPKTVESSYTINAPSTYAYLFAIDIKEREIVWLNTALQSSSHIAALSSVRVDDYLEIVKAINIKSFFTMLATEVVSSPEQADVIVGIKHYDVAENQKYISPLNTSQILPLMNNKK